jgi:SAM-dependent methyltransferase
MNWHETFLRLKARHSAGSFLVTLKNITDIVLRHPRWYKSISLSSEDIEAQSYKKYLGGGAEAWEKRGAFQLYFLKKMGLQPFCRLLDIGCGPLRAGVHLVGYLDSGNYFGIDYNESFIHAARRIIDDTDLSGKEPVLRVIENFEFARLNSDFDFMLAFSVLNHCKRSEQKHFFKMVPGVLKKAGKLYVTHSFWFDNSFLKGTGLSVKRVFNKPNDIDQKLHMPGWGFTENSEIFPILEISR